MTFYFGGGYKSDSDPGTAFVEGYKKSRLGKLLGDAYSAPKEQRSGLLGQIAQIDPQAAMGADERFAKLDERAAKQLQEYARLTHAAWKSGNKPMAEGIYGQAVQLAKQVYPGFEAGPLDDATADMFGQLANSSSASGVQSTYVDGNGNRVAIMRDGSVRTLGANDMGMSQQTITVEGPNGEPVQMTFDKRTGNYRPLSVGGSSAMGERQPISIEYDGPPEDRAAFEQLVAADAQQPFVPGNYSARLPQQNVQPAQRQWTQNTPNPYGNATPGVGMTAAGKAYAQENAQQQAQIDALRTRGQIEAENAVNQASALAPISVQTEADKTLAVEAAKNQAQVSAKLGQRARDDRESLMLLKEAAGLLKTATSGGAEEMWKGANRYVGRTTEGAKADAQLNVLSGKLVGKVPRFEGPQSNIDVQLYQQMAGDLANPNKTRGERIAAAQGMINLISKYQDYAKRPAQAPGGRKVVRTGTQNGRKVVQYSDGSVDYAD